ncbi:hypothetical protein ACFQGX_06325 [Nonomuraea dietziae]|uniref:hypothetical protein n=1 Tax=Nonomuraea dietziae TaxID=65515 RepID=UPI0036129CAA
MALAPELSMTSGGLPPAKRGCRTLVISLVALCLICALGYFVANSGWWMSLAYAWPNPPSKIQISSGLSAATPKGLAALVGAAAGAEEAGACAGVAQAASAPAAGMRTALRRSSRRVM